MVFFFKKPREALRKAGRAFDKKFISGDWDARRQEREAAQTATQKSQNRIEELISGQERQGTQFFDTEAQRNKERDIYGSMFTDRATQNIEQNIGNVARNEGLYRGALSNAKDVSNQNMRNARRAYQTLSPHYRDAMDAAIDESKNAMSLRDYMDPNNQVATGVRNLYNTEGEGAFQRYDTQAQNLQREGQASFGILSALGSQAAANAGLGPQTVGQQMAQMAMANRQAAEAYAGTQRRMQQLRDMGMSTREALRQTGLERGFERSDAAYEAGRLAKEDAMRRMGDFEGFEDRNIGRTRGISDRLVGLSGQELASRGRQEDVRFGGRGTIDQLMHDRDMQRLSRQTDLDKSRLGYETGISGMRMGREDINLDTLLGQIQAQAADRVAGENARRGLLGTLISAGATVAGGTAGGPAGASAANLGAGAMTNALMPQQPIPQISQSGGYQTFQPSGMSLGVDPYGTPTQPTQPAYAPQPSYGRYNLGANYGTPSVNPYPYG